MDRREDESNWAHACRLLGLHSLRVAREDAAPSAAEAPLQAGSDEPSFASDHESGGWRFGDPSASRPRSIRKEASIAECHPFCSQETASGAPAP